MFCILIIKVLFVGGIIILCFIFTILRKASSIVIFLEFFVLTFQVDYLIFSFFKLRYNWHIALCWFQVYIQTRIRYFYILGNDHHSECI